MPELFENTLHSTLIPTKVASDISGYNPDYLARLCRMGTIEGVQVGRSWFVNRTSLENFVKAQEERKLERAAEISVARGKEYRRAQRASAMDAITTIGTNVRNSITAHVSRPSRTATPVLLRPMAACAIALMVVAGTAFVSTSAAALSVASTLPSVAQRVALMASPRVFTNNATFRVTETNVEAKTNNVALALPSAKEISHTFAFAGAVSGTAYAEQYSDEARSTFTDTEMARVGETRVASVAAAIIDPKSAALGAIAGYVNIGIAARDASTNVGATYLETIGGVADGSLTAAALMRDGSIRMPRITDTILASYESAIVAWNDATPKAAGTIVLGAYDLGDTTGRVVAAVPAAMRAGNRMIAQQTVDTSLAISEEVTRREVALVAPVAGYGARATDTYLGMLGNGAVLTARAYDSVTSMQASVASVPVRAQNMMLGTIGYTMALIDGNETIAYDATDAPASAVSFMPVSWQGSIGRLFEGLSRPILAFIGSGVRTVAGLFPGGGVMSPALTVVQLGPAETLALPMPAGSLTIAQGTGSTIGGNTIVQNFIQNIFPQSVIGNASDEAVLAIVRPFVNQSIESALRGRGNGGGGSGGGSNDGVSSDGATLTNVDIQSGNASFTNLSADSATFGTTVTGTLTSGSTTLGTTNVNGDLNVSGTITAGTLSVANLSSDSAVIAPYFTATSTTATSTFPNISSTNFDTTNLLSVNATTTNFYAVAANIVSAVLGNFSATTANIVTAVITDLTATNATFVNSTTTNATTTALYTSNLGIGGSIFTNLLGYGLTNVGGALSVSTSTFSGAGSNFNADLLDGLDSTYLLANSFSSTSAAYYLAQNSIAGFSTTSANYWLTTKSTTDLAEGTNLYFTNARADARINATSTIGTLTSAPNLGTVSTALNGILRATSGVLSASLVNLALDVTGVLPEANGGTGATSFGIPFFNYFSATTTNALAEGSINKYYSDARVQTFLNSLDKGYFFSTTSTAYFLSQNQGSAFSTTSANHWLTTKSTTNLAEGTNLYYTDARARAAISTTATGLTYNTTTGVLSLSAGYTIPLTASTTEWNTAYVNRITSATYPLQISANTISLAFGTTTANTWSQLQTFSSGINVGASTFTSFLGNGLTNVGGALTVSTTSLASGFYQQDGNSFGALATLGTTDNNALRFISNGTEGIRILPSGNVGIGNNNPQYRADVAGQVRINQSGNPVATPYTLSVQDIGSNNAWIEILNNAGANKGAFFGLTGNNFEQWNYQGGDILFYTNPSASNGTERFRITNTGNIGIGTSSPFAKLSVAGDIALTGGIYDSNGTRGTNGQILSTTGTGVQWVSTSTLGLVTGVSSVFGRTGAVTAQSGDYTTAQVTESGNLYYTDARARAAISVTGAPLLYNNTTGVLSINQASGSLAGYLSSTDWNAFSIKQDALTFTYPLVNTANTVSLAFGTSTSNTWGGTQTFTNAPVLGSLTGFLKATAGVLSTSLIDLSTDVSSTLPSTNGGTGFNTYTPGDILYADNTGTLTKLPVGATGQVLKVQAGFPAWGVDQTIGSGGTGDGVFATSSGMIYPIDTSNVLVIGSNATSTANSIFEVNGQQYISARLGIGTTSPSATLSVGGNALVNGTGTFNQLIDAGLTANALTYSNGAKQLASVTLGNGLTLTSGTLAVSTTSISGSGSGLNADFLDGFDSPYFLDRANHTGTQLASTISDFASTARGLISTTATGLTYNNTTGVLSLSAGYTIPLTASTTEWNTAYTNRITSANAPLSIANNVISITQSGTATDGYLSATDWNSFNSRLSTTTLGLFDKGFFFSTTSASYFLSQNQGNAFSTTSADYWKTQRDFFSTTSANYLLTTYDKGFFFSTTSANHWLTTKSTTNLAEGTNLYYTDARSRAAISLTTTGTSGAATYNSTTGVFNIPQYLDTNTTYTAAYPITLTGTTFGLAFGTTTANTWSALQTFTSGINVGASTFTSLLGNGLTNVGGTLTVSTSSLASGFFQQGGNSFGATAVLGTNDSNPLQFETNNAVAMTILANGNVGIGTTSPFRNLSITGAVPTIALSNTSGSANTYQLRSGATGSGTFDIYDTNNNTSMFGILPNVNGYGQVVIGTTTNNVSGNNSRLFIFGGANGANIDAMGDKFQSGGAGDTVSIEAEGSDWGVPGTNISSIAIRYYGPAFPNIGTQMGSPYQRLAMLDFGTASSSQILNRNATPIQFGTNNIERMRLTATGQLGIGTTSPSALLSVAGSSYLGGTLTATGTITFTNLGTGLVNSTAGVLSNATAGVDYAPATSGTSLLYGDGAGGFSNATVAGPLSFSGGILGLGTVDISSNTNLAVSAPITLTGDTIGITQATASTNGYLSSADWNSFNSRLSTTTLGLFDKGFFFSTTSADYWKSARDFFSTTSAAYFLSQNQGSAFSTTSADFWLTGKTTTNLAEGTNLYYTDARVNTFVAGSTTIPKTYTSNTFTAAQAFNAGVTTNALTIGSLNGPLQANNGVVSATSSIGVLYGGTGLTMAPTNGQLLLGNASGGYALTATSSLGIALADTTGVLPIARGGTNATSQTTNGIAYFNGTTLTTGSALTYDGTDVALTGGTITAPQFRANDSVNNPGYSWPTDMTTGMYHAGSNLIGFATGGIGRLFIDGSGYLGIGTSSPSSALSVEGDALINGGVTANSFTRGADTITDFTGTGLVNVGGALTVSTSSLANLNADLLDGLDSTYFLANSFSTTSANYWKSVNNFFSTTSADFWLTGKSTTNLAEGTNLYYTNARADARIAAATTTIRGMFGVTAPLTYNSTTGIFGITQSGTATDGYLSATDWNSFNSRLSTTTLGLFDKGFFFSTTSASYFLSQNQGNAFSTTSADYWKTQRDFFSTTSANAWLTTKSTTNLAEGTNLYYTDARVNSFINGSTTIPKTYTANTWSALQTFSNGVNIGGSTFTSLLGNGLTNVGGTLTVSTTSLASGFFLQNGNSFGTTAVLGTNDNNALTFETNNTTRLTIDTSGNVGIGTTPSNAKLDILAAYATTGYPLKVVNTGYYNAYFQGADANDQASFYMENDRGGFASYGGFLYGGSTSGLGNLFGVSRTDRLFMFADGASNLGMYVGTLGAQPFVIGTNNLERVRVSDTGNLGIGTTSPFAKLSVAGDIALTGGIYANGTRGTNGQVLQTTGTGVQWVSTSTLGFSSASGSANQVAYFNGANTLTGTAGFTFSGANLAVPGTITATSQFVGIGGSGSSATPSYTFASDLTTGIYHPANNVIGFSTGGVPRAVIDGSGYFGLGTSTPSATLSVEGDALVNGGINGTSFTRGADTITDFTGTGLIVSGGALTVSTSSLANLNADLLDGLDSTYFLANSFSTTSASYFLSQNQGNAFSTTSANYWKSVNNFYSTTSADYWLTTKSTTNLAEGTNLYFTNARADARINATSTIGTLTSAPNLGTVSTALTGILKATSGVLSTAVAGTDYQVPLSFTYPLVNTANTISLAFGTTTANTWSALQTFTNGINVNGETFTDLTGTGLTNVGGALTLNATGDWTGTFDGQEGSYYLANSFSTTSAAYFLSQNQGSAFSTTSANFWLTGKTTTNLAEGTNLYYTDARVNSFVAGSTTIPKTYTANSFSAAQTFTGGITTNALSVGSLNGVLHATAGVVSASNVLLGSEVSGTLPVANGGTGSTTLSGILLGNGTGAVQTLGIGTGLVLNTGVLSVSTSSLANLNADLLDGLDSTYFLANSFSTTSANYWKSVNNFFSTTSADFWLTGKSTTNLAEGTNLYYTDARSRAAISLTTTGTSGAATYNSTTGVFNIPQYQAAGTYVTSISIASANGFTGSSSGGATPTLTLGTSVTGLLKGNGTAISAAVAGTDYQVPLSFTYPLVNTANTISLAFGTTTANTWSALQTFTSGINVGASTFTSLLGNGLTNVGGTLTVSTSSLASGFFQQGGNSFGATAVLGTNDSNPLQFETNNAVAMTILANGNVGIGTTSPFRNLSIEAADPILVLSDTTALGSTFQIRNGVASNNLLDVYDAANNTSMLSIVSNNNNNGQVRIGTSTNVTGNNSRLFVFGGTNGANIDAMGDRSINGGLGDAVSIEAEGSDWGVGGNTNSIALRYYGASFPSGIINALGITTSNKAILDFGTASTSVIRTIGTTPILFGIANSEVMRLTTTGLGVGTTSPWGKLSASTTSATSPALSIQQNGAGSAAIFMGGNVGIGTTSPYANLSISGNLALTGGIFDNTATLGTNGMVLQSTGTGVQWMATSSLGLGTVTSVDVNGGGTGLSFFGGPVTTSGIITLQGTLSAANGGTGSTTLSGILLGNGTGIVQTLGIGNGLTLGSGILSVSTTSLGSGFFLQNGNSFGTTAVLGTNDSNLLQFETNNVARLTIDTSGNVGIGTTSPNPIARLVVDGNTLLHVAANQNLGILSGVDGLTLLAINDALNANVALTFLASSTNFASGNVGIGTTTPINNLTVSGDITPAGNYDTLGQLAIRGSTNPNKVLMLGIDTNAAANYGYIQSGLDNVGLTALSLNPQGGNVGIGTTSPYAKLSVTGDIALTGGIYDNNATRGTAGMVLQTTGTGVQWVATSTLGISGGGGVGAGTTGQFPYYAASGSSLTATSSLFLTDSSRIGVGTTTPDSRLELSGSSAGSTLTTLNPDTTLLISNRSSSLNTFASLAFRTQNASALSTTTAQISAIKTSTTPSLHSGALAFLTLNAGTLSEKMRIINTGLVGIGTASPNAGIHLVSLSAPVTTGNSGATGTDLLNVSGGAGGDSSSNGSFVTGGNGGGITMTAGTGGSILGSPTGTGLAGTGGTVLIKGGAGGTGGGATPLYGVGGSVTIAGGIGSSNFSGNGGSGGNLYLGGGSSPGFGNAGGGDVFLYGGYKSGTGTAGNVYIGVNTSNGVANGNIGIGTTTNVTQRLTVGGNLRLTGALYDSTNSAGTTGMVLQTTSTGTQWVVTSTLGIAGGITGSGAANQITYWSGSSTLTGNSAFVFNGTNVGIGTSTPLSRLHVYDSNSATDSTVGMTIQQAGSGNALLHFRNPSYTYDIGIDSSLGILKIGPSSWGGSLGVDSSGNVGIGTNPNATYGVLTVAGRAVFTYPDRGLGVMYDGSSNGYWIGGTSNGSVAFSEWTGIERMRLTSAGNLGIGTTTPSTLFEVNGIAAISRDTTSDYAVLNFSRGSGSNYEWQQYVNNTASPSFIIGKAGGTAVMTLTDAGNVGIGTTNPDLALHVRSAVTYDGTFFRGGSLKLEDSTAATTGVGGAIDFSGKYDSGGSYSVFGKIKGIKENSTNSDASGALALMTSSAGGVLTEKLRISSNGNVGIGTTTPSAKLEIYSTAGDQIRLTGANSDGALVTSGNNLILGSWNTPANRLVLNMSTGNVGIGTTTPIARLSIANSSADGLTISNTSQSADNRIFAIQNIGSTLRIAPLNDAGSATADGLQINRAGNVGIGNTAPAQKLEVTGTDAAALASGSGANGALRLGASGSGAVLDGGISSTGTPYAWLQPRYFNSYSTNYNLSLNPNGGNVGIGTTAPGSKLDLLVANTVNVNDGISVSRGTIPATNGTIFGLRLKSDSGGTYRGALTMANSGGAEIEALTVSNVGNIGIGSTSPSSKLTVAGAGLFQTPSNTANALAVANSTGTNVFSVSTLNSASSIFSVATSTGGVYFNVKSTGVVALPAYGAGSVTTDGSGNIVVSSDERLKDLNGSFDRGLEDIMALNPILYHWNTMSGFDQTLQYAGFSAQNVQASIPEAVDTDPRGYLSLQDRPIIAASVNAIKELAGRTDALSTATTSLATRMALIESNAAADKTKAKLPQALTATEITAVSLQIAQGVSAGTMHAQSVNADGTVSAARYVVPATADTFTFGSTTVAIELPQEALVQGGMVDMYKLATYNLASITSLAARTDLLAMRLDTIESRLAILETASSTVSDDAQGAIGLAASSVMHILESFGIVIRDGIAQVATLVTHQLVLSESEDGTSSAGSVTVPAGDTEYAVENPLLLPTSKIFITFTSSVDGSWYITDKKQGSFVVKLSQAQSIPVSFDYFLIQTEGQIAAVGGTEPPETPMTPDPTPEAPTPVSQNGEPTVSLKGSAAVQIAQGASWTDPGATATAADGTDLTSSIAVSGGVDTETPGMYTITYRATDAAGKYGEASRVVNVLAPSMGAPAEEPPAEEPVVAGPVEEPPAEPEASAPVSAAPSEGAPAS